MTQPEITKSENPNTITFNEALAMFALLRMLGVKSERIFFGCADTFFYVQVNSGDDDYDITLNVGPFYGEIAAVQAQFTACADHYNKEMTQKERQALYETTVVSKSQVMVVAALVAHGLTMPALVLAQQHPDDAVRPN